jgi:hypothetical protein
MDGLILAAILAFALIAATEGSPQKIREIAKIKGIEEGKIVWHFGPCGSFVEIEAFRFEMLIGERKAHCFIEKLNNEFYEGMTIEVVYRRSRLLKGIRIVSVNGMESVKFVFPQYSLRGHIA